MGLFYANLYSYWGTEMILLLLKLDFSAIPDLNTVICSRTMVLLYPFTCFCLKNRSFLEGDVRQSVFIPSWKQEFQLTLRPLFYDLCCCMSGYEQHYLMPLKPNTDNHAKQCDCLDSQFPLSRLWCEFPWKII